MPLMFTTCPTPRPHSFPGRFSHARPALSALARTSCPPSPARRAPGSGARPSHRGAIQRRGSQCRATAPWPSRPSLLGYPIPNPREQEPGPGDPRAGRRPWGGGQAACGESRGRGRAPQGRGSGHSRGRARVLGEPAEWPGRKEGARGTQRGAAGGDGRAAGAGREDGEGGGRRGKGHEQGGGNGRGKRGPWTPGGRTSLAMVTSMISRGQLNMQTDTRFGPAAGNLDFFSTRSRMSSGRGAHITGYGHLRTRSLRGRRVGADAA